MKPGRPPAFCATLKLLAASVVRRRNVPPFSKVSEQWPRSFGLRSDAPSPASSLSPARPDRNRATDLPHSWPQTAPLAPPQRSEAPHSVAERRRRHIQLQPPEVGRS